MSDKRMTDEEMDNAGLTDEERAALESDDDIINPEGEDEGTQPEGRDDQPDDNDDAEPEAKDEDEPEASANNDAPGRDDGQPADDPAATADGDKPAQSSQYSPSLRTEVPEDLKERIGQIATDKAELRKKYNEGDIDFDEYDQQREALDEQRRQLEQTQFKAEIAQEMKEDRWLNHDVANFMADNPEYKPGSALYALLDNEVRIMQSKAEDEGKEPLDPAILQAAHQTIRDKLAKDLGVAPAPARKGKPPAKRDVPPTLGSLPAAETEDTDGGRWAHLDRLADSDPVAFEEKMASMSEADQDAYLAAR